MQGTGAGHRQLAQQDGLAHLDLDTLAWQPGTPPIRRAIADSLADITAFQKAHSSWVIEGCYADLDMLLDWIRAYPEPDDTFSQRAHQALYASFTGTKSRLTSNQRSAP